MKSIRQWAIESGVDIRSAQRWAREYQTRVGGLVETVSGFRVSEEQWRAIRDDHKKE